MNERLVRRRGIVNEFLSARSILPLALLASSLAAFGQAGARIDLGRLQTGAQVSFTRSASGQWGMAIDGGPAPRIVQPQPAKVEIYRDDNDIRELAAGYATVRKSPDGVDALAEIKY